jgi:hypothetical protein
MPDRPQERSSSLVTPFLGGIKSTLSNRNPGDVSIVKNSDRFCVTIECGHLQPGRRVWSDVFYVGKRSSGDLILKGLILADNLPQPQEFSLVATINITESSLTVDEVCSMAGF